MFIRNNTNVSDVFVVLNDNLPIDWCARYDIQGELSIYNNNELSGYPIRRGIFGSGEINPRLRERHPDVSCMVFLVLSDIFFMHMPIYLFSANPTWWQRAKKYFYIKSLTHKEKYNLRYLKTMCG